VQGMDPLFMDPAQMETYMARDYQKMAVVVRESHMAEE
jgi:hypothetical protein